MTSAPTWVCSNAVSMPTVATFCSCNVLLVKQARCGGDAGRALRLGTEPSRDRSDRGGQTACKPGSVPRAHDTRGWMAIHLGRPSPDASRDLPGRRRGNPPDRNRSAVPTWSCSRWGLPCRPRCRGRGALLPHPFTLTRLRPGGASVGGLLSVALSLGSPPPGVTRHRVSVEPGLSSPGTGAEPRCRERPSGRLTTSTPRSPEGPRQPGSARPRGARRSRRPPRRSRPRGGSGAGRPRARPRSPGPGSRSRRRPARA